ncbi:uncharacterized protein PHALS_02406, partial [Plasmopara halstedii]
MKTHYGSTAESIRRLSCPPLKCCLRQSSLDSSKLDEGWIEDIFFAHFDVGLCSNVCFMKAKVTVCDPSEVHVLAERSFTNLSSDA